MFDKMIFHNRPLNVISFIESKISITERYYVRDESTVRDVFPGDFKRANKYIRQ